VEDVSKSTNPYISISQGREFIYISSIERH
jgi:hypothetical protein